jgi:hypothetical protein
MAPGEINGFVEDLAEASVEDGAVVAAEADFVTGSRFK